MYWHNFKVSVSFYPNDESALCWTSEPETDGAETREVFTTPAALLSFLSELVASLAPKAEAAAPTCRCFTRALILSTCFSKLVIGLFLLVG